MKIFFEEENQKFKIAKTLEEKLDYAYEVYLKAKQLLKKLDLEGRDRLIVQRFHDGAVSFMKMVLDVNDDERMVALVEKMRMMKRYDPFFLPRSREIELIYNLPSLPIIDEAKSRAQYNWRRIAKNSMALKRHNIMEVNDAAREKDKSMDMEYYSNEKRAVNRVILKEGRFYKPLIDFGLDDELQFVPYSTLDMSSHGRLEYAAYVINTRGEISLFNHMFGEDHLAHSSMNAGVPVFAAGEIKIVDGQLKELTTHSGHYWPSKKNIYNTLEYFISRGVGVEDVEIYLSANYADKPALNLTASEVIAWGRGAEKRQEDLIAAANEYDVENVKKILFEEEPEVYMQKNLSAFALAAAKGNLPVIMALWKNRMKAKVNEVALLDNFDQFERTPLMYAADFGQLPVVRYLIAMGANINARDRNGETPLIIAAQNGDFDVVCELIDKGADIWLEDKEHHEALWWAIDSKNIRIANFIKAVVAAKTGCKCCMSDDIRTFLSEEYPPLSDHEELQIFKLVIAKGSLIILKEMLGFIGRTKDKYIIEEFFNKKNEFLRYASTIKGVGAAEVVRLLIEAGADINAKSILGMTALMFAVKEKNFKVVKELLSLGADITIKNNLGFTARDLAMGDVGIIKLLEETGKKAAKKTELEVVRAEDAETKENVLLPQ